MSENTKRTRLFILFFAIFAILFNVAFFVCVTDYTTTRWIGYAGIILAYIFFIITCFSIPAVKGGAIYGYPKIYIGFLVFLSEFIAGLLFMYVNNDSYVLPLMVQVIIISSGVGIFTVLMLTESHSIESECIDAKKLYFIKKASYALQSTMNRVNDKTLFKTIETLYDAVRNSQVRSIPSTYDEESKLMDIINQIDLEILNGNYGNIQQLVNQGITLLNTRDNKIKLSR